MTEATRVTQPSSVVSQWQNMVTTLAGQHHYDDRLGDVNSDAPKNTQCDNNNWLGDTTGDAHGAAT